MITESQLYDANKEAVRRGEQKDLPTGDANSDVLTKAVILILEEFIEGVVLEADLHPHEAAPMADVSVVELLKIS